MIQQGCQIWTRGLLDLSHIFLAFTQHFVSNWIRNMKCVPKPTVLIMCNVGMVELKRYCMISSVLNSVVTFTILGQNWHILPELDITAAVL